MVKERLDTPSAHKFIHGRLENLSLTLDWQDCMIVLFSSISGLSEVDCRSSTLLDSVASHSILQKATGLTSGATSTMHG